MSAKSEIEANEIRRAIEELKRIDLLYSRTVHVLKERTGKSSKAFMRFYVIGNPFPSSQPPRLLDITWYLAKITGFPIRERNGSRHIHTHTTNDHEIVFLAAEKLGISPRLISVERF